MYTRLVARPRPGGAAPKGQLRPGRGPQKPSLEPGFYDVFSLHPYSPNSERTGEVQGDHRRVSAALNDALLPAQAFGEPAEGGEAQEDPEQRPGPAPGERQDQGGCETQGRVFAQEQMLLVVLWHPMLLRTRPCRVSVYAGRLRGRLPP